MTLKIYDGNIWYPVNHDVSNQKIENQTAKLQYFIGVGVAIGIGIEWVLFIDCE